MSKIFMYIIISIFSLTFIFGMGCIIEAIYLTISKNKSLFSYDVVKYNFLVGIILIALSAILLLLTLIIFKKIRIGG